MEWLKQKAEQARDFMLHSTKFFATVVVLGMAAVGGYAIYRTHPIGSTGFENFSGDPPRPVPTPLPLPLPPEPVQPTGPPPPLPQALEAVTVTIHAPQPAVVIDGVSTLFIAETTGPAGTPKWRIIPADAGTIRKTSADGRRAELLGNGPGHCSIMVDVAGDGRQIANDLIEIEIVALERRDEQQPQQQQQANQQPNMPPPAPQPTTIAQLVSGALAAVDSGNKKAESRIVAGCFRSVIGRINAGHVAPDSDPMVEVESQVNDALKQDASRWQGFLAACAVILEQLRAQGQVTTAATKISTLSEMSAVLLAQ